MEYGKEHTIYFLGIGGIGMSALARYFHYHGANVLGYDRISTPLTQKLEKEGIKVHYKDQPDQLPEKIDLVIYTPAIPHDLGEFVSLKKSGVPLMKRAAVLGAITKNIPTIAVGGTHGKTTITSMIAHLLHEATGKVTAFIGGLANNFKSNLVLTDQPDWIVVEADEFDKSFLQLQPMITLLSSMDPDHLDIYGSEEEMIMTYRQFIKKTLPQGKVIAHYGLKTGATSNEITYGINPQADIFAQNIHIREGRFYFEIVSKHFGIAATSLALPGRYNIENALAATAAALEAGIGLQQIASAIQSYSGVWRRFDIRINKPDFVFIDDYAHHPKELQSCIEAAREMYPGKKITGIFQPHLFSRTRDLLEGFAISLGLLDEVILLEIYPARELPIEGITSSLLLQKINCNKKVLLQKNEVLNYLIANPTDVLLTLGAGDIDKIVEPIQKHFEQ